MAQIKSPLRDFKFGGKSILLFGDIVQAPAVTRSPGDFLEAFAQFHSEELFGNFVHWEPKELMRQKSDEMELISILDYVRKHSDGQELDKIIEGFLQSIFLPGKVDEIIDQFDLFVGKDSPKGMVITFTNYDAQFYNSEILKRRIAENKCEKIHLSAKFFVKEASHFVSNNNNSNSREIARQASLVRIHIASNEEVKIFCGAMKKKYVNTIIPFSLDVCIGTRVILLQNLDLTTGLINGARRIVEQYLSNLDILSVKFDFQKPDDAVIFILRKNSVEYQISQGKAIFIYMFPLKLSWAATAHKSQGQSRHSYRKKNICSWFILCGAFKSEIIS